MNQPPHEYDPNRPDIPAAPGEPPSQPMTYQPVYPPPPPPTFAYPPPPFMQPMPPMAYGAPYPAQVGQGDGMAVAGLVLGIISIPMAGLGFCGLIFGVLGLILSLQGRASIRNHTWAITGIVLSSVGLSLSILPTLFNLPVFFYWLLALFSH